MTGLVPAYLLKVIPYFFMIFLHLYHLLPFLLRYVSYLFYRHYPHLFDMMVNLLNLKGMLLHMYYSITEKPTQLSYSFLCFEDWFVILVDEIYSLVGFVYS